MNYNYGGAVAYSPEIIPSYIERMNDVTGVDIREVVENLDFELHDKIRYGWENLSREQLQNLANKYGASYIIREEYLPLELRIVYYNPHFNVYAIK